MGKKQMAYSTSRNLIQVTKCVLSYVLRWLLNITVYKQTKKYRKQPSYPIIIANCLNKLQ